MKHLELKIEGMTCGHCVMSVKKELAKIDGVTVEEVTMGKAKVMFDENKFQQSKFTEVIDEAGYKLVEMV